MPSLIWSRGVGPNVSGDDPLTGWQFERVPASFARGAVVTVLQRSTLTNTFSSIFSGSQNIVQRSPIPAGGTAGMTPVSFNTPVIDFVASPDDLISIQNDNAGDNEATIDGIITIEPI